MGDAVFGRDDFFMDVVQRDGEVVCWCWTIVVIVLFDVPFTEAATDDASMNLVTAKREMPFQRLIN